MCKAGRVLVLNLLFFPFLLLWNLLMKLSCFNKDINDNKLKALRSNEIEYESQIQMWFTMFLVLRLGPSIDKSVSLAISALAYFGTKIFLSESGSWLDKFLNAIFVFLESCLKGFVAVLLAIDILLLEWRFVVILLAYFISMSMFHLVMSMLPTIGEGESFALQKCVACLASLIYLTMEMWNVFDTYHVESFQTEMWRNGSSKFSQLNEVTFNNLDC